MRTLRIILHNLGPIAGLLLFIAALTVLHTELKTYTLPDITRHIADLPRHTVGWAILFTIINYFILTFYDTLAVRYVGYPLSYPRIAYASFCGYAVSNNMGFSLISGGTVRYRLYSAWDLTAIDITKIIVFCVVTMWTGFLALAGIIFTFTQFSLPTVPHFSFIPTRILGAASLSIVLIYLGYGIIFRRLIHIRDFFFAPPSVKLLAFQIVISVLDWIFAASVLWILMPQAATVAWTEFMGIFLLSQLGGIASQVPGGVGVFEALMVILLPHEIPRSQIFGILIVYRGIYYILPLVAAIVLIGIQEFINHSRTLLKFVTATSRLSAVIMPQILSLGALIGGTVLLISGSIPPINWRFHMISIHIPLPVIELSHFLGSLTGAGLLILSRSLYRRIDFSYYVTIALLIAGILFSMLKGLDYEVAIILGIILFAMLPSKRYFHRKSYFMTRMYTFRWNVV